MKRAAIFLGSLFALAATIAIAWHAVDVFGEHDLSAYANWRSACAIVLSALPYMATILVSAIAWRIMLSKMGEDHSLIDLAGIMCVSQAGKYVPGNVVSHIGRATMALSHGIKARPLGFSMGAEVAIASITGLVVGLLALGLSPSGWPQQWVPLPSPSWWVFSASIAVFVFALRPSLLWWIPVVSCYVVVYLLAGLSVWLLAFVALPGVSHDPALLISAFALGWLAGFLTPGSPAGIGVREGAMLIIIQQAYDPGHALFIVLALRLATIAGDGMMLGLGWKYLLIAPGRPGSYRQTKELTVSHAPSIELEPTGERMVMEHYSGSLSDQVIKLLHEATYRFARPYVEGKRVLDYGCGSGYGTSSLAGVARNIVGVDVAADAVMHAKNNFKAPNLEFKEIDPNYPLPFSSASFDTVLSFQVFEHVKDENRYLSEIKRVLVTGGTLVLVTPDRSSRLLPGQRPWNRWHVREYSRSSLQGVVSGHFPHVQMLSMGAIPEMAAIEINRCSRTKWATLPFTLPVIPDVVRVWLLNMLHRLRPSKKTASPQPCPFTIDDVVIDSSMPGALNLIAVATSQEAIKQ